MKEGEYGEGGTQDSGPQTASCSQNRLLTDLVRRHRGARSAGRCSIGGRSSAHAHWRDAARRPVHSGGEFGCRHVGELQSGRTSTFTYQASGPASLPYAGTYSETGTV